MKRIFLVLMIFLTILFSSLGKSFADNFYKGQPVLKIYNYLYDEPNKIYYPQSYGSAVYLGDNIIVTNNHVVKDEKGGYTGFYEVCETIKFTQKPKCFTSANLLYVDKTKDLAYLKLDNIPVSDKKVILSDKELNIGDKIVTYGYPQNGGNTITFTSGQISGFDSGKYKIDASIDSGSSGGGAFDKDGKLVGITTSVVSGYTTLGYLVSGNDITNFLQKKGNITNLKSFNTIDLKKFLDKYNKRINSDNISTDYIDIKNISKYGFKIIENYFDKDEEINNYYLISKSGHTSVSIGTKILNYKESKFTKKDGENLSKILNIKNITSQIIYNKGKKFNYSLFYDKKTKNIKINFLRYSINYEINGNLEEKDEIKNAILLLFNDSYIKSLMNYNNVISLDGISINKESGFELTKYISDDLNIKIYGYNKIGDTTIVELLVNTSKFIKPVEYNKLSNFLAAQQKQYSLKGVKIDNFVDEKGNFFSYFKINNKKNIVYTFVVLKELNGYLYSYEFKILIYGKANIDSCIKNFINNLNFEGNNIYSKEDIKKSGIKKLSTIVFKNDPTENIYSSDLLKDFKLNISKEDSFKILKEIVGKEFQISNIENKNSNYFKYKNLLKNSSINLLKRKNGKKYLDKFDNYIPKIKTEKLKKVSGKLNNLDFNNPKIKKYKEILEYLKFKILFELEQRK